MLQNAGFYRKLHDERIREGWARNPVTIPDTELSRLKLPEDFILLDTYDKLYEEGEKQHNCVVSYANRICNGECIIYALDRDDTHCTIELQLDEEGPYVSQCLTFANEEPPREIVDYVEDCVKNGQERNTMSEIA